MTLNYFLYIEESFDDEYLFVEVNFLDGSR